MALVLSSISLQFPILVGLTSCKDLGLIFWGVEMLTANSKKCQRRVRHKNHQFVPRCRSQVTIHSGSQKIMKMTQELIAFLIKTFRQEKKIHQKKDGILFKHLFLNKYRLSSFRILCSLQASLSVFIPFPILLILNILPLV